MPECKPQLFAANRRIPEIVTDPCLSASHNPKRPDAFGIGIVTDPCLSASHNGLANVAKVPIIVTDPCLSASHNIGVDQSMAWVL